jgi:hypothetical protein
MKLFRLPVALLVALNVFAQDAQRPILISHDLVDGPLGGEHHVEDLQVFENGKVVYVEEGTKNSSYVTTISPDEVRNLKQLLDSSDLRSLPEKVPSKTRPIDLFWQKSLQINRAGRIQKIEVTNFYPFLNLHGDAYPRALIRLTCRLQRIKTTVNSTRSKDDDDWCEALLNGNRTQADCKPDEGQARIIAGEGWGPVRVGANYKTVDAFLGKGKSGKRYASVYFENYDAKGLQVSFDNANNSVRAIYFYNGERDSTEFAAFCGQVEREINWQSSVADLKKAFGKPVQEFSGTDTAATWTRLVFDGIDFRFENEKMVRIGVSGK